MDAKIERIPKEGSKKKITKFGWKSYLCVVDAFLIKVGNFVFSGYEIQSLREEIRKVFPHRRMKATNRISRCERSWVETAIFNLLNYKNRKYDFMSHSHHCVHQKAYEFRWKVLKMLLTTKV